MSYKIPLFDLNFNDKEENAILEVLRSRWISTGPKVASFENKFAEMLNVENAIALTNCTMSLHLALMLIGISPDDEVICPSLTFVATVNAIRYMDAIPVFADVTSYENPTIDPKDILEKITPETKAIMVMHYGGFSCDMSRILEIAKNHDLKVIEDACHGPLAEYKGKKLGTIGDIGCFSFFSNKNISTGEGGMLITNNGEYAERARLLKSHGMTSMSYERSKGHSTAYDVVELGYNYRMDDIRAALGLAQLNKLKDDLISRAEIRCMYLDQLNGVDNIIIPFKDYPYFSSNYIFPIILKNSNFSKRNFVREQLAEAGIQTSVHYPAVHSFSIYKDYYIELKITDYLADNLITLPMYSKLNATNVCYIVSTLGKFSIMNDKVILVGGFVEIIELCENINIEIIGIIDPIYKHNYLGYPIIGTDLNVKKIKRVYSEIPLTITPDKPDLREKLSVLYMKHGFKFKTLISNQAYISKSALIGSGVVIQNAANISSEVQIGDFVKVNSCANIMHNVDIGQNTTIAPNAVILGYSTIGSGCYIGSNATILPNLQICENIIIGAGAVVTKDIAIPGTKWVGIPARLLK